MRLSFAAAITVIAASPALADCNAELDTILKASLATPYRVEMTSTANGNSTKIKGEVIYPDSFHIQTDSSDMVMVKKKVWMKLDGKWQAMPADAAAMMATMIENGVTKGIEAVKDAKCLGREDYEGQSYLAYSFSTSGEVMGIASTSAVKLYATDDGLPAWQVIEGEAMGTRSTTVQKITFDPSISITPPQ